MNTAQYLFERWWFFPPTWLVFQLVKLGKTSKVDFLNADFWNSIQLWNRFPFWWNNCFTCQKSFYHSHYQKVFIISELNQIHSVLVWLLVFTTGFWVIYFYFYFFFRQLLPTHYSFNWLIFPVVLNAFFFLAQTVDTRGHVEHWHISPHLQPFSKYGRLNSIKGYLGVVCIRPYKARLQSVKWCHFQQPVWHTGEFPRWTWFVSWVWILVMLKELVRVNIVVSCCAGGLAWSL